MSNRSKVLASSLLVAAFITGTVVGGAITSAWGAGWSQGGDSSLERSNRDNDRRRRRSYADQLQDELQLTATQRDSLDAILERRRVEIRRLWQEVGPRFDTLRLEIREQIRNTLDAEQQERYAAILVEHDEKSHRRNGKEGGGEARRDK